MKNINRLFRMGIHKFLALLLLLLSSFYSYSQIVGDSDTDYKSSLHDKIIHDSSFVELCTCNLIRDNQEIVKYYEKQEAGDSIVWELTYVNLPSTWTLNRVSDNIQWYPYADEIERTFSYKPDSIDNFLKVDIEHGRNEGYGSISFNTYLKDDFIGTITSTKLSLSIANSSSVVRVEKDKLLHYYEGKIYMDSDFKGAQLQVYDLHGRLLLDQLIQSSTIDFVAVKRASYLVNIVRDGNILKALKI